MLLSRPSILKFTLERHKGFTLLELLVVIAIIGILAAIGVPAYSGYVSQARDKEAQNSLQSIAMMQKGFYTENFYYYSTSTDTDQSSIINTNLFGSASGPLPTTGGFYNFWIKNSSGGAQASTFEAVAQLKNDPTKTFTINEKMVKTKTNSLMSHRGDSAILSGW